jgi:hypothetical protein
VCGPEEKASKKETDKLTCRLNAGGVSGTLGQDSARWLTTDLPRLSHDEVEVVRLGRASTTELLVRAESRLDRRSAAAVSGGGKWR